MSRRNKNEDGSEVTTYDESETVSEEELTEGQDVPKKKREPSPKTVAKNAIFSYIFDGNNRENLPDELQGLVDTYTAVPGRAGGTGEARNSVASQIREMFLTDEVIHEDVFYNKFKIGRTEMKRRIYNLRKKNADPVDNIYVKFDAISQNYSVIGYGEIEPEGFSD